MKKIALLFIIVGAVLWYRQSMEANSPAPTQEITSEAIAAEYSFTATADGQTAQQLLDAEAEELEYTDYGQAGKFVTSIDGVAADEGHYWAFYLNGEYSQTGISQTILKKGDTITFTYEQIDPAQL